MSRFVLTGLSRLTVRVAELLLERGAEVTLVTEHHDHELLAVMPADVTLIGRAGPWSGRLHEAELAGAECLLPLSEDDLENLRVVAAAGDLAPDVPVVLRAFDARLVEQFEAGTNVRRCYSASALAAPEFVAAALGEEIVETLRLADDEVPLCLLEVRPDSPLVGITPATMKADWSCAAVARRAGAGAWEPAAGDDGAFAAGDSVLVGGLLLDVLRLTANNRATPASFPRPRVRGSGRPGSSNPANHWFVAAIVALIVLFVGTTIVFTISLDLGLVDAAYQSVGNAFGNIVLETAPSWVKVFGLIVMIGSAVLLGVVLAQVTAAVTSNRLDQQAGRRARKMRNHVIIAGLGVVGYRVERLLDELGIDSVIIERESTDRFREAAAFRAPVLIGDVRLGENLERAGVRNATCIVACTDDDLANISACSQARRFTPEIRTVARIFDEELAHGLGGFGIDRALSMSTVSAGAFVGAALDERARRRFVLGELELVALRYEPQHAVSADVVATWRAEGLRIVAIQAPGSAPGSPIAAKNGIAAGTAVIVAGPEAIVTQRLFATTP